MSRACRSTRCAPASTGASRASRSISTCCEKQGVGPNVACFAGHSAIRTFVMGEDATERTATDDEIAQMADARARGDGGRRGRLRLLDRRGAQRRRRHADAVAPGRRQGAARAGPRDGRGRPRRLHADQGQHDLDPLSRGDRGRGQAPGADRRAVPSNTNPTRGLHHLDEVNAARARGHRLVAQTSCCPLSMDFTFKSPYLFESMQAWKPAMAAHDAAELDEDLPRPRLARGGAQGARRAARPAAVQQRMEQAVRRRDGEGGEPQARGRDARRSRQAAPARIRSTASSTSRCRRTSTRCSWRSCCTTTTRRSARSWPTRHPHLAVATPARTSPSSATPASACTCSATGAATSACSTCRRRCIA